MSLPTIVRTPHELTIANVWVNSCDSVSTPGEAAIAAVLLAAEGPALVGSPEQVVDKILSYHELYGHDLQSISLPTTLPFDQQLDLLERFATEVIPAVRAAAPTTLWEEADPYGGRPAVAGAHEPDAAARITELNDQHRSQHAFVS